MEPLCNSHLCFYMCLRAGWLGMPGVSTHTPIHCSAQTVNIKVIIMQSTIEDHGCSNLILLGLQCFFASSLFVCVLTSGALFSSDHGAEAEGLCCGDSVG